MSAAASPSPRVLALAGGKGGVGTTLLAANLAIHLARQGRETFLLDLAATGPSAHAQAGLAFPTRHLGERLPAAEAARHPRHGPPPAVCDGPELTALAVAGGTPNLKVVAGVPDMAACPERPDTFSAALLAEAAGLSCDVVVADLGSDRSRAARLACRAASTLLLVTTPEPESLRGMLRLHAAVLYGILEEALGENGAAECGPIFAARGLRGVLEGLRDRSRDYHRVLDALAARRFGLILNQVRNQADVEAATRVGAVLSMVQAVVVDPVLSLEYDLSAVQATGGGRVLSQRYPNAPVARGLERLTTSLMAPAPRDRKPRGGDRYAPVATWHHYRLLALDPKASPREVQRHYEWIRAPFAAGGEAEAVADRAHLDGVLGRVEAAYRTLIFLENRREYDKQLVTSGVLERSALRELAGDADAAEARAVREAAESREPEAAGPEAAAASSGAGSEPASAVEPETGPGQGGGAEASRDDAGRGFRRGRGRRRGTGRIPSPVTGRGSLFEEAAGSVSSAAGETADPLEAVRDDASAPPIQDSQGPAAPVFRDEPLADEAPGAARRYRGATLRSLRQRRRLDVERIAAITKIRAPQIEALEGDRYEALPVPVFLKGFLKAYALCLDLDPEEVVRDYMEGYNSWSRMRP